MTVNFLRNWTAKQLVLSLIMLAPVILAAYVWTLNHYLSRGEEPALLRQALVKYSKGYSPKIVVVSGSNALHGIDFMQMEKHFKQPVIAYADNGSFPLQHKLNALTDALEQGDTLLLPLEWTLYTYPDTLPDFYLDHLFNSDGAFNFEYRNLPWLDRLDLLLLQTPWSHAKYGLWHSLRSGFNLEKRGTLVWPADQLELPDTRARGGINDLPPEQFPEMSPEYCDAYILGRSHSRTLSKAFQENLATLDQIAQRGVNILFTWPVVVDQLDHYCYTSNLSSNLQVFADKITDTLTQHNFQMLGHYKDFAYGSNCFLNTYFHITPECATQNTTKLISFMEHNNPGLRPSKETPPPTAAFNQYILQNTKLDLRPITLNKLIKVNRDTKNWRDVLHLESGWSEPEETSVWSSGKRASLKIKLADQQQPLYLSLKGHYFNGNEKTRVLMNGEEVGQFDLSSVQIALPAGQTPHLTVEFQFLSAISPKSLGLSGDDRAIKFALQALMLTTEADPIEM
ncbi:MAG: hypothetical protein MI864_12755 [Pseudomonadales bacterium]|nr:hypothetical protein [Pseudomonadales bacterium]